MNNIKIITDSTSDLPLEIIEKYDIEVLPLTVQFGNEVYRDKVDITLTEFLEKMNTSGIFPTTSQINPQTFYECYKKHLDNGFKVISIHISSKMSGTFQSACIAKDMLETENIKVIDSLNVTSGLGLLVLKACSLKEAGTDINSIVDTVENLIPHIKSVLAFESLENLVKGGRLSKAAGLVGNLLGLRLILEVKDGEMAVLDKVRGNKKAIKTILDYVEEKEIKTDEICSLLYIDSDEIRKALREKLIETNRRFFENEVGCVVGTHSGKGACGIFFIENF